MLRVSSRTLIRSRPSSLSGARLASRFAAATSVSNSHLQLNSFDWKNYCEAQQPYPHFPRVNNLTTFRRNFSSDLHSSVMSHVSRAAYDEAISSSADTIGKVITPIKSASDKREYRVITLENGLRAVLVHDAETDKAAASMDVAVGHFSDPDDMPGLAHFCEHMLFLGTEKYPDENSYSSFLNSHGGSSNAYTSTENTNYYFDVSKEHLEEALDRFAAFFTVPLFAPSCVDRELNAVHNENSKNLLVDTWRFFQLLKSTSNPAHAWSKFGTGNLSTLRDGPNEKGLVVRDELINWYKRYYSSHLMRCCIIGRESLDQLEAIVRAKFSAVPRGAGVEKPVFPTDALTPSQLQRMIKVVPVKDTRNLQLLWFFNSTVQHLFQEKPLELLSHCLGHESAGSILSYLKSKNYANGLSSGVKNAASSFSLFAVTVDLTEEGLKHTEEIIEIVFSYLKHVLLKSINEAPHKWAEEIFSEVKSVNAMNFRFKSKESPQSLVSALSSNLQRFPMEHVINGPYEIQKYDEALLKSFIEALCDVSLLRVHTVSQSFKKDWETQSKQVLKEKWYQTEYTDDAISAELLSACSNPKVIEALHLPLPNEFIADNFTIKHPQFSEEQITKKIDYAPVKLDLQEISKPAESKEEKQDGSDAPVAIPLSSHPLSSVWYKCDRTFGLPKSVLLLRFQIPSVYQSPLNALCADLYAELLQELLNEFAYHSQVAGFSYYFYSTQQGLQVSIGGYNQKQEKLLHAILAQMKKTHVVPLKKEADFNRLKESMKRNLQNFAKENPYSHAMFDEIQSLEQNIWNHHEKLAVIDSITPASLDAFISNILLTHAEMELFVHGNIVPDEVKHLASLVQGTLNFAPIFPSQLPTNRVVRFDPAKVYLRQCPNLNKEDPNSCSLNLYQLGENTVELHAMAELFAHLIKEPLYNQLRTQEQLGYLVFSNLVVIKGVLHFRVMIQSSNAPPNYLDYRIEAFLKWWCSKELPEKFEKQPDFFQTNINAVVAKKMEKDKTLSAESTRLWNEISLKRFQFDRVEREVAVLRSITPQQLLEFMSRFVEMQPTVDGVISQRAKYNIQYFGKKYLGDIPEVVSRETETRVQFANSPLDEIVKLKAASGEGESGAAKVAASTTAAAVLPPSNGEISSSPAPPTAASEVFLPPVPVDHRNIVMVEDINAFKRAMPLFPSFQ